MTINPAEPSQFNVATMMQRAAANECPGHDEPYVPRTGIVETVLDKFARVEHLCEPDELSPIIKAGYTDNERRLMAESQADREVADEIVAMLDRKNAAYGRNLPRHGLKGVTIRLMDKVQRLENLVLGNVQNKVPEEAVEDTLADTAGYCIKVLALIRLGDMTVEGNWKEANGLEGFHHKRAAERDE